VDNDIIDLRAGAAPVVRFRPVKVADAPGAAGELSLAYRDAVAQARAPDLVLVAGLVLLALLTLYHHGHEVGRYVSLERVVEDGKDDYYESLRRSSEGWHDGRHDLVPRLNYFLGVVRRAYREFEERAGQVKTARGAKTALVEAAIGGFPGDFTLSTLERACPGVSRDMIRRVLRDKQKAGGVTCLGRGPGAVWRKKG
jgi:hypothetical protein